MKKFLQIKFSDKKVYHIPASVIADSRAKYYADQWVDQFPKSKSSYDEIYKEEYKLIEDDDSELMDWAFNSMDWKDVKKFAILVKGEKADYDKEWLNCSAKIVRK